MMLLINPEALSIEPGTPNPAGAPANVGDLCQYHAHSQKLRLLFPAAVCMAAIACCHGSAGACALALGAKRNEKKFKLALTRAPILRELNIMSPLCCGTQSP